MSERRTGIPDEERGTRDCSVRCGGRRTSKEPIRSVPRARISLTRSRRALSAAATAIPKATWAALNYTSIFGDNQAETRPVYFGMINDWRIRNKAKLVVVDPRMTVTASKADRWMAIRPGTDMALGLALAYHILSEGLHDRKFCDDWVLGWETWRDSILNAGYTPDWAEPITSNSRGPDPQTGGGRLQAPTAA